ncbi:MAG: hypothetical protein CMO46_03035 [Verrucomicrobiales bacterium]|nr:hypothetical protein [Verrucomicrobiales bacterium]MBD28406.1 hypothetical protein [Verrucomicrobiaceae bacterium]|tara:strand:+ start:439 stop:1902 length:1464 start_codon:yes stop_codon:yes gene_type:complete
MKNMDHCGRIQNVATRRALLQRAGGGIGMLALNSLLNQSSIGSQNNSINPLASKKPHHKAKAKNVIWLFINGGPSHVDTWDYKPGLVKADGQKLDGFDKTTGFFDNAVGPLLKSPFEFKQHGQSGMWASSLFPNLSKHVDKMAFIKSFHTQSNNHSPALFMANTGVTRMSHPCVGSWVTYGLGSENENLPAFVVMSDPLNRGLPKGHAANWSSGFLPGAYQGTWVRSKGEPIPNLKRIGELSDQQQRAQLDLIGKLNNEHQKKYPEDRELTARIRSFELAYRMQQEAPECFEVDSEPEHIKNLYGLNEKRCSHFARQCLMARRMVERGVRFVQIYSGGMENARSWDGHGNIKKNHSQFAGETDQPIAGLLSDLEQRGLLKDTLVIWGGEFGRLPVSQLSGGKPTGRDHNPHAGCYWFAGGGSKGGTSYGETDEIGHKAAVDKVEIHDIHATILHLLGMEHKKLTYLHSGRRFRLTDVAGNVINDVVA